MPSIALPVSLRGQLLNTGAYYSPYALFVANELGFWLDPSDVANLSWRRNLLTFTEEFDNAAWVKTSVTVTPNSSTAPDGTLTADTVTPTSGNSSIRWSGVVVPNGTSITGSVWLRSVSGSAGVSVYVGRADFGSVTAIPVTLTTAWQRVSGSFVSDGSNMQLSVGGFSTLSTGEDILIWGAQLETGSVATEYQRITDVNTEVVERFPTATLFQDTAGTTPVTTPGQTVALALDKSRGLVLGPELVTNGGFDNGTTGWTGQTNTTLSVVGGELQVSLSATSSTYTFQDIPTVAGRTYRVSLNIRAASGTLNVGVWSGPFTGVIYETSNIIENGLFQLVTFVFVATTATTRLGFGQNVSSTTYFVGNISVRELPGFHATQSTAAARPIYGRHPFGGRRNLLTFTEQFDNAGWTKNSAISLATGAADPIGGTAATTLTAPNADGSITQTYTQLPSTAYTFSIWARRVSGTGAVQIRTSNDPLSFQTITLTSSWQRFSVTTTSNLAGSVNCSLRVRVSGDVIQVWGAQLEVGSTATPYQRVTTQFDVTEAGVPDVHYLFHGGASDPRWMITPTITPGTDKVQVFAGVRVISNAAASVITELSVNATTNNGAALLDLAFQSVPERVRFVSRGTSNGGSVWASGPLAPYSAVITGQGDIPADASALRFNGTQVAQSTVDQGTGNYLAYPLYIGMRGGTSLPFNGHNYGLIVRFGANLDPSVVAQTERWMAGKTGIVI